MRERKRRISVLAFLFLSFAGGILYQDLQDRFRDTPQVAGTVTQAPANAVLASDAFKKLPIKGRAPRTNYAREQFDNDWEVVGACDVRNHILKRDMTDIKTVSDTDCTVLSGVLQDPYTGNKISFKRGAGTSTQVQIDHVVALSDAWQKGAQALTPAQRRAFANDALNLLAVDGPTNQKKSDGDAATWLPPNKTYRCRYVARQIAVKIKYTLWVTQAEHDAIRRVLGSCPDQVLPLTEQP